MAPRLNPRIIRAQSKHFLMVYIRRPFFYDKHLWLLVVILCVTFIVGKCYSPANEVLNHHLVFKESESHESNAETDDIREIGIFPYTKPVLDHESCGSESAKQSKTRGPSIMFSLSTPPLEIKPYMLDWGQKHLYDLSLAFLTVKNVDTRDNLSIYDIYSSNSQFYPCKSHEIVLAPSETTLLCFVFLPTQPGLYSARLVLQTSFGGFLIQAKGFATEFPFCAKPTSDLGYSASRRWKSKLSLLNPFSEPIYVLGNCPVFSKAIFRSCTLGDSNDYSLLNTEEWFGPQELDSAIELHSLCQSNGNTTDALTLQGFGGSLLLFEGSNPVHNLEVSINIQTSLESNSSESKSDSCSYPLKKEDYKKNTGDNPLQVLRIKVSGSTCARDGILIHNCKGFLIPPGESVILQISCMSEFSALTFQVHLELLLSSSVLVVPMKANLLVYMLNFFKRSKLIMGLKKAVILILTVASMVPIVVFLLFPSVKSYSNPRSSKLPDQRKRSPSSVKAKNGSVKSVRKREKLLSESAKRCSNALVPNKLNTNLPLDNQPEIRSKSSELSPSVEHVHDSSSDSRNLIVRIGKEKRSRRKKKKSSGIITTTSVLEVSSSQSGNSTPSSPASPYLTVTRQTKPWLENSGAEHSIEAKNQFPHTHDEQNNDKRRYSEVPNPKLRPLNDNEVYNPTHDKIRSLSSRGKQSVTAKIAVRPVSSSTTSPWTRNSPFFAGSTSRIDPQARAPGTKLLDTGKTDDMRVEDKYTYNIWGDHLFGLSLTNEVSTVWSGAGANSSCQSFFVEEP